MQRQDERLYRLRHVEEGIRRDERGAGQGRGLGRAGGRWLLGRVAARSCFVILTCGVVLGLQGGQAAGQQHVLLEVVLDAPDGLVLRDGVVCSEAVVSDK